MRICSLEERPLPATVLVGTDKGMAKNPCCIGFLDPPAGENQFCFNSKQHPVVPAFAATINQAQSLNLKRVGFHLMIAASSNGQLLAVLFRTSDC